MVGLLSMFIVAVLMVVTILSDLRSMRIPNWTSLVGVLVFMTLVVWTLPIDETLSRVAIAAAVLLIGFVLFAVNTMGAGDVKIFSVLMLFVPSIQIASFMLIFSACMIAGILAVIIARKFFEHPESNWGFLRNEKRLPMGLSIGSAGLIQMLLT